jgi:hypothetical protein
MRRLALISAGILFFFALTSDCGRADDPNRREREENAKNVERLKGLEGFWVGVTYVRPYRDLKKEQIKTDVELRLRNAGVRVYPLEELAAKDLDKRAILNVCVDFGNATREIPARSSRITVSIVQMVIIPREGAFPSPGVINPQKVIFTDSTTNEYAVFGALRDDDAQGVRTVRDLVADLVDRLLNDYFAANPKK